MLVYYCLGVFVIDVLVLVVRLLDQLLRACCYLFMLVACIVIPYCVVVYVGFILNLQVLLTSFFAPATSAEWLAGQAPLIHTL